LDSRTQGGVRLSNEMLAAAIKKLGRGMNMTLEIDHLRPPSWWQFWKGSVTTPPLSAAAPAVLEPPLDEISLIQELLQGATRHRASRRTTPTRDDSRRDDRSDTRSSSEREPFRGGGGESAGAGASGSWDNAPVGARGVDAAGRMVAGAAAGAALGVAAANAAAESNDTDANTDTSTAY
jgi:hypothetical protein